MTGSHEEAFLFEHQFNGVCVRLISLPGRPAGCFAPPRRTAETAGGSKDPNLLVLSVLMVLRDPGGTMVLWREGSRGLGSQTDSREDLPGRDTWKCCWSF